jgi:hypothetical protein
MPRCFFVSYFRVPSLPAHLCQIYFTTFFAENNTPRSSHVKANSLYNLMRMSFQHLRFFISFKSSAILFLHSNSTSPSMDFSTLRFWSFSFHFPFFNSPSPLLNGTVNHSTPPRHAASTKTFLPPHFNARAYTKQRQTGFIHFTTTWTHGLIFFGHHYYTPIHGSSSSNTNQPRLFPSLYRWCLSLPGFLFFGHCVSYFKLQLFLFSYKSVSVLYRSGLYFF